MDAVVRTERLAKRYRGTTAVADATMSVPAGSIYALLGPNGAGKTTLMRCVLGLVRPSGGRADLFGQPAWGADPRIRTAVGAMIGGPGLVGALSARANLRRQARLRGATRSDAAQQADAALAADGLDRLGRTASRRLSRGEQQRVALAGAFLGDPTLLILDEPTEGLDPLAIAALRERLAAAQAGGATVVVSSHLLSEVEQLATHCAVLAGGVVRVEGAVADLGGGEPRLRFVVNPVERALAVLTESGCLASMAGSGVITVTARPDDAPALVAQLVAASVAVSEVAPVRLGLEAIYLAAIGAAGGPSAGAAA